MGVGADRLNDPETLFDNARMNRTKLWTRRSPRWALMALAFCLIAVCTRAGSTAAALTDPSRPVTVKVTVLNGSITVKGYQGKEVRVETDAGSVSVAQADNDITVQPSLGRPADLRLSVPRRSSLHLKCTSGGNIQVEEIEGSIEAEGSNASITLQQISGVVVAHSLQGRMRVQMDKVEPGKPMSFSTMNGDIELSLPADTRADLRLQTLNGSVRCDFPITLEASSPQTPGKKVSGAINNGGPEYQVKTLNGSIHVKKNPPPPQR